MSPDLHNLHCAPGNWTPGGVVKAFTDGLKEAVDESLEDLSFRSGCDPEPHGAGSQELPEVVTPEIFMDRYTHQAATKAILLIESALINAIPKPSAQGSSLSVTVPVVLNGRVTDIVKQRYVDVGWVNVTISAVDLESTQVSLFFP
jgi:hypothetical protein